jgi:ABC-type enterochelin transport system ATPase subunit
MCLAVGHLNVKYIEDPNSLSQRRDAAVAMVVKQLAELVLFLSPV